MATNPRRKNRKEEPAEETQTVDTQATEEERDPLNDALDEAFGLPPRKRWTNVPRRVNDVQGVVGVIIDAVMNIISLLVYIPAKILENFMGRNKPGTKILAAMMFIVGVILSADSFYQTLGNPPLFPFFEEPGAWIGWGWFTVWVTPIFWIAILVSLAVQLLESFTLRGKNPDEAKQEYEEVKHHTLPKKNANVIDLVEHRRRVYKRSGMNSPKLLGLLILAVFLSDIASAFISHNPWGQAPHVFIGMVIYNFFCIVSSETGYILWKEVNK
jgi:hypothetical protein